MINPSTLSLPGSDSSTPIAIRISVHVLTELLPVSIAVVICYIIKKGNARSRGSVVGIVTGYGLDDGGVGVPVPVG
jgi:hypothetical protein